MGFGAGGQDESPAIKAVLPAKRIWRKGCVPGVQGKIVTQQAFIDECTARLEKPGRGRLWLGHMPRQLAKR